MWDLTNSEIKIHKDERGTCRTVISRKDKDEETGEEISKYMRILVGFKKDVEVKNKSRIRIKNAFPTFITIDTDEINEKTNEPKRKNIIKIMILDFDVIEEGVLENDKIREFKTNSVEVKKEETPDFGFNNFGDDLPF